LDTLAGGNFTAWIAAKHNDSSFEDALLHKITEWFG
jgi:hypothetical protein